MQNLRDGDCLVAIARVVNVLCHHAQHGDGRLCRVLGTIDEQHTATGKRGELRAVIASDGRPTRRQRREPDPEHAAGPFAARRDEDRSAMHADEGLRQGEPEAEPLVAAGRLRFLLAEQVEEVRHRLGIDARTVVDYFNGDAVAVGASPQNDVPAFGRSSEHCSRADCQRPARYALDRFRTPGSPVASRATDRVARHAGEG